MIGQQTISIGRNKPQIKLEYFLFWRFVYPWKFQKQTLSRGHAVGNHFHLLWENFQLATRACFSEYAFGFRIATDNSPVGRTT